MRDYYSYSYVKVITFGFYKSDRFEMIEHYLDLRFHVYAMSMVILQPDIKMHC